MRVAPTITMYSDSTGASGKVRDQAFGADITPTTGNNGNAGFILNAGSGSAATVYNYTGQWTADARM